MGFFTGDMATGSVGNLSAEQDALLKKLMGVISPQVGAGAEAYSGQMTPGTNELLEQLIGRAGGYVQSPLYQGSENVLSRILNANPDYGATEDYWRKAFLDPAMSTFKKSVLPSIREGFVGKGAFLSSGRDKAEADATSDLMTNLTGQLASLMYNEKNDTLNRALTGVTSAQGLENNIMNMLNVGGQLQRGMEGEKLAEDYSKWQYSQPYNNPWLQYIMPTVGTQTATPYVYQQSPSTAGILTSTALSTLGSGLSQGLGQGLGGWMTNYFSNKYPGTTT